LEWASTEGFAIVTFNVAHFAQLHREWLTSGRHHCGIVVSNQRPINILLKKLLNLARSLTREEMQDRLEFLSQW
jgi:hypothetical protein